jgi:hypothetical protein
MALGYERKGFIGSKSILGFVDLESLLSAPYIFHPASLLYPS